MHSRMIPVKSSNIDGYIYLDGKYLVVAFKSGAYYRYDDVPQKIADDFVGAASMGTFLNQHIKKIYDCAPLSNDDLDALLNKFPETKAGSAPRVRTFTAADFASFYAHFPILSVMF